MHNIAITHIRESQKLINSEDIKLGFHPLGITMNKIKEIIIKKHTTKINDLTLQ